jgi:hypothetical protein
MAPIEAKAELQNCCFFTASEKSNSLKIKKEVVPFK